MVSLGPTGEHSRLTIGRSGDNDLIVADESVSAHHAALYLTSEGPELEDLGSTNGTFVGGARLTHGQRHRILYEHQFKLGEANAVLHRNEVGRVAITAETIIPIREIPVGQRRVIVPGKSKPTVGFFEVAGGVLGGLLAGILGGLAGAALGKLVRGLMNTKGASITPAFVPLERARTELSFPPGHPVAGRAYVVHPHDDGRYFCVEHFHEQLFSEKRAELLTILAALGATKVTMRCVASSGRKAGAHAAVPGIDVGDVETHAHGESARKNEGHFEEHYVPHGDPRLPDRLVWYHHEPDWRRWAERRLALGLSQFTCRLLYTESLGVDVGLKAKLEEIGVEVGADFASFQEEAWEVEFVG